MMGLGTLLALSMIVATVILGSRAIARRTGRRAFSGRWAGIVVAAGILLTGCLVAWLWPPSDLVAFGLAVAAVAGGVGLVAHGLVGWLEPPGRD